MFALFQMSPSRINEILKHEYAQFPKVKDTSRSLFTAVIHTPKALISTVYIIREKKQADPCPMTMKKQQRVMESPT